jgi:hypothetical protein
MPKKEPQKNARQKRKELPLVDFKSEYPCYANPAGVDLYGGDVTAVQKKRDALVNLCLGTAPPPEARITFRLHWGAVKFKTNGFPWPPKAVAFIKLWPESRMNIHMNRFLGPQSVGPIGFKDCSGRSQPIGNTVFRHDSASKSRDYRYSMLNPL